MERKRIECQEPDYVLAVVKLPDGPRECKFHCVDTMPLGVSSEYFRRSKDAASEFDIVWEQLGALSMDLDTDEIKAYIPFKMGRDILMACSPGWDEVQKKTESAPTSLTTSSPDSVPTD